MITDVICPRVNKNMWGRREKERRKEKCSFRIQGAQRNAVAHPFTIHRKRKRERKEKCSFRIQGAQRNAVAHPFTIHRKKKREGEGEIE